MKWNNKKLIGSIVILLCISVSAFAQGKVTLKLTLSNAMPSLGWYMPQKIDLSTTQPATLKKLPAGLRAPIFGVLPFGSAETARGRIFHVVLDEPAGAPSVLYADANGDGDLTNDETPNWTGYTSNGLTSWDGGAFLTLGTGPSAVSLKVAFYRFDKTDPQRQSYKNNLFYYRDYAYEGFVTLGGVSYKAAISDELARGDFRSSGVVLLLDINADGRFQSPREALDAHLPFNIKGKTYEITDMAGIGGSFSIVISARTVAETIPLPDLRIGKKIVTFDTVDMDGKPVHFPLDFKGKVVMLDFWATWCGPCMEEVPGLVGSYNKYQPMGFDVLGITLDLVNQADTVRSVERENCMVWRQIYDGGGWQSKLAQRFGIDSIPQAFLVDGDTGEILADSSSLRGGALQGTIESALKRHAAIAAPSKR
jgi:thiol-disulfide isomerase/thioredoxin